MLKKHVVLLPLFACPMLLIMGALNGQPHPFAPALEASFVAQSVSCEVPIEKLPASAVLAQAIAKLAPNKASWLRTQIWQKQQCEEMCFEAEGTLVRGPNHCARLELTIRAGAGQTAVTVVSDGVGLAHARKRAGQPVDVESQQFAKGNAAITPEQIAEIISAHGCGGPYALLRELADKLENMETATGAWDNQQVVRLTGQVKSTANPDPAKGLAVPPRVCRLYLDAKTLWPVRIEWWSAAPAAAAADLILQIEFRRPTINQPLSHEECVREFSYQPEE
jgi:hypothetical protein